MTRREVQADHAAVRRYLIIVRRWQDGSRVHVASPNCWVQRGAETHAVAFHPADLKGGIR